MEGFNLCYALCVVTLLFSDSHGYVEREWKEEGSACRLEDGLPGVCKLTEDCQANRDLIRVDMNKLDGRFCSYKGTSDPVSCCPIPTPPTTTPPPTQSSLFQPNPTDSSREEPDFEPEDECDLEDGSVGVCKLISECPVNQELMQEDEEILRRFRLCGDKSSEDVFCCPVTTPPANFEPGDACDLNDGSRGVCKLPSECPANQKLRAQGIIPNECSFNKGRSLDCCPVETPITANPHTPNRQLPHDPHFDDGCNLEDGTRGVCRRPTECSANSSPDAPSRFAPVDEEITSGMSSQMCSEYAKFLIVPSKPSLQVGNSKDNLKNETRCHVGIGREMITKGKKAAPKEFPHMATLGYGPKSNIDWSCGGSLISPRFVLTAAHCAEKQARGNVTWVRLGDVDISSTSDDETHAVTMQVKRIINHPKYTPPARYYDICLLELTRDVKFSHYIRPACLDTLPDRSYDRAIATGWGRTDPNVIEGTNLLMKVALNITSTENCSHSFRAEIGKPTLKHGVYGDSMICAGGKASANKDELTGDTCQGDSGGPLQVLLEEPYCMFSIVGLTSFGSIACGYADTASIYTRVSHFIPWIEKNVWP